MYNLTLRLAFMSILFVGLLAGASSQASEYPKVSGFSAYLLNSHTGQLSYDVIENSSELGNVPASSLASKSALIVVHVALGPRSVMTGQVRLEVTASSYFARRPASHVLFNRVSRLGPVAEDGTTHVGFWLDDVGCESLVLKATVILGSARASKKGVLPFVCYE